ncbi:MAG: Omp28-related outer membrane protein [Muribaculaceae bacterium]|nr:Omp28-related outer membrane protein [Muribaculaceae bacterium]
MKKTLLSLALVVACSALANAQLIQQAPVELGMMPHIVGAPAKRSLGQNQLYLGHYVTDDLGQQGVGLTSLDEVVKLGTVLSIDQLQGFAGGTIRAIRFGLWQPVTDAAVYVWPVTSISPLAVGEPVVAQDVATTQVGWNQVTLDNPYTIDTDGIVGLMLGYQYRQIMGTDNSCYPVLAVNQGAIATTYAYGYLGGSSVQRWADVGLTQFGNLCIQAIVEGENLQGYEFHMSDLFVPAYAKVSEGLNFNLSMWNYGIRTLDDYVLDMSVDGQVVGQLQSPVALTPEKVEVTLNCPLNGLDLTVGKHTFAIQLASLNGETVNDAQLLTGEFTAYNESFPRKKNLIEQFTSQTCTYCPWGEAILKRLDEMRDDIAWVAVHGNMGSPDDVFHTTKSDQLMTYLGTNAYPTAAFNRYDFTGSGELTMGMGYSLSMTQTVADYISADCFDSNTTPVAASIDLTGTYDPETRELSVKVAGEGTSEFKTLFGSIVGVTVYLTEDGLVARQLNNGTWVNNYTHNHVMRDMLSTITGSAIKWDDDAKHYANEFVTTLDENWNSDNMHIIAFVHRKGSGVKKQVINCDMVAISDLPAPSDAVVGDVTGDGVVDIADVNAIINMMLGKVEAVPAADLNGDGNVDISDVNAVINLMLGK